MAKRAAKPVAVDPQDAARTKFLEQGTDPVIAKKALEDATAVSRALWLSFLTFGTYLVITFAGVDHRDLLLEEPIVLPVLNAQLPLVTFFWVAPILFVIFHLYLLLSLKLLADQVHSYLGHMEELGLDGDAQDRARLQLPNFVVVQVLGGTSEQVNSWAGKLMSFTAFLTLVAGPLILLLFAQLMFLPYHGWGVTMAQRVMVVVDLVLLWYFWRTIRKPQQNVFHFRGALVSAAILTLTFFGFMYPGERFYGWMPKMVFNETGFHGNLVDDWDEVGLSIFYNTLVLSDEKLVDDDYFKKLELRNDEKNLKPWEGERSYASVLKSRDFRNADFSNIDLRKADLSNSVFDNAGLVSASLQGASLNMASLQGALLNGASLQGASLNEASLQGAVLFGTSLQGASLDMASLQGAVLTTSLLQGASLQSSKLQGASLDQVSLQGASLKHAWLQGASLNMALLQGTSLDWATLDGATLFRANLQGASLDGASLQATLIQEASVWRSSGRPFKGLAVAVHINTSRLQTESFETLLADALRGVPRFAVAEIRSSIAQLNPNVPDPQKMFDWSKILREMEDTPNFSNQVVESLTETACEVEAAPVVAQGIVKVRLYFQDDARMEVLPLIEMLLTGCPGTTGMDQSYFDLLNAMKAEYTSILKYK